MNEPTSIVVADDHPLFRDGVIRTLSAAPEIEVLGEADSAQTALEQTCQHLPDVVLLDIDMPGGGLQAAKDIGTACPMIRTVMLTVSEDEEIVYDALKAGVSGYVLKGVSGMELISIIRIVKAGESYVTPSLAVSLLQASNQLQRTNDSVGELTPRERDILTQLALGGSNKDIADALRISERTVKHHMTNVLKKLHLKNRVEAALFAQKLSVREEWTLGGEK